MAAFDDLDRRLRALNATRLKLEGLFRSGLVARRDLERLYEGLYVAAVTSFEDFLEAAFFELMLDADARTGEIVPRADFRSAQVLREFVLGDRPFVNWLPYARTESRAKVYLRGARPFERPDAADRTQMKRWTTIRNAIAHTSREARRRFERDILAGVPLPPRERTPAGYLRSTPRPGITQYQNITAQMVGIASKLR